MRTLERFIPSNYAEHTVEDLPGFTYYTHDHDNKFYLLVFSSARKVNHDSHEWYSTNERRQNAINNKIQSAKARLQYKQDRKDQKAKLNNQPNPIKVGDIFSYSWGYEQTNVEFWQVTEVKNKTIKLREIAQEFRHNEGGSAMSSCTIGLKDQFLNTITITKRLQWSSETNYALSMDHGILSPWNGQPKYTSWYA